MGPVYLNDPNEQCAYLQGFSLTHYVVNVVTFGGGKLTKASLIQGIFQVWFQKAQRL